jgi:hypothetical protein
MAQMMATSKLLIIISWACQEMMEWMSIELVGSLDDLCQDLAPNS